MGDRGQTLKVADPTAQSAQCLDRAKDLYNSPATQAGTELQYGPFDQVDRVVARGHEVAYQRDLWGDITLIQDSDLGGERASTYNTFGELETTTDAKGQVTRYLYDQLGRLIERDNLDANGVVESKDTWEWDIVQSPGQTPVGLYGAVRKSVSSSGHETHYRYDWAGRLSSKERVYGAVNSPNRPRRQASYHYNVRGRIDHIDYPDDTGLSFGAYYEYAASGAVTAIRDSSAAGPYLWRAMASNDFDQLWKERFLSNDHRSWRTYYPITGLPKTIRTGRCPNNRCRTGIQNLEYTYSDDGNLLTRQDHNRSRARKETFEYDHLDRLLSIQVGNNAKQSFSYSTGGNLKTRPLDDDSGQMTLSYGDTSFPHRVTQSSWGGFTEDYTYDDNGNLTSRSSGDPTRADLDHIVYTRFDKPASLEVKIGNASFSEQFIYDAEDQLVHKQGDPAGETLYFDDLYYEVRTDTEMEGHYLVSNGSRVVVEVVRKKNANLTTKLALHDDHLGSVVVTNDPDQTDFAQRRKFAPFGGFRVDSEAGDSDRPKTRLGYTGHEHFNKLGLVNMKGRIYDSHMGRFLQPDPFVPEPWNSQSWNRYSYVVNNPLNWVDPSGFTPCESDPEKCVKQRDGGGGGAGSVDASVTEHSGWEYVGATPEGVPTYQGSGRSDPRGGGIVGGRRLGFSGTVGDSGAGEPGEGGNSSTGEGKQTGKDEFRPNQGGTPKASKYGTTPRSTVQSTELAIIGFSALEAAAAAAAAAAAWGAVVTLRVLAATRAGAQAAPKLLNTARGNLLQGAQNPKLRNLINQLYRRNAQVGSGSTADAIRYELRTGQLLSRSGHSLKGQEMRTALNRLMKSGGLDSGDAQIAHHILNDLQRALSGL